MFILETFNKLIPAVDGVIFDLFGQQPSGFSLMIENQDANEEMVYHLESSADGVTWTNIEFAATGNTTASTFLLVAGEVHTLKVSTVASRIRLKGYGDLPAAFGLTFYRPSPTGDTPSVQVFTH